MLKIVIADDEDVIRGGLIQYINWEQLGYEVAGEASNGKEALEVVQRVHPDVLLTDIKMPFLDGLTLVEELKAKFPDLYVIILSGHDEFEYARRALKAGVYEFLLKPIQINNLKQLLTKIKDEYDQRHSVREEYKKLKGIEKESKLQMRRKIYTDILIENIPFNELKASLALVDMLEDQSYYVAGIFEMENLALRTIDSDYLELIEIDREFGTQVDLIMDNSTNCYLFKSGNCERILCQKASSALELESMMRLIRNNLKKQENKLYPISMSYGNIYSGLEGLKQSYWEARSDCEKINNKDWSQVLYPNKTPTQPMTLMNFDASTLILEVQTGSKSGIDKELHLFEETLKSEGITSYMMLIMIVSDIYFQIIKLPEGLNTTTTQILDDPEFYYNKIISQKDIPSIIHQLKKVCYKINEFYEELNQGKFTGILKRVTDYIQANYMKENLMIKEVAQYAYVSSSYLSIILKKELGITFIEYLTKIRMEKAKRLLEETQMKQYEIAEACGYSNPTYFSTIFKRYFGVSPSSYLSIKKEDRE